MQCVRYDPNFSLKNVKKKRKKELKTEWNSSVWRYVKDIYVLCCRDVRWSKQANQLALDHPVS